TASDQMARALREGMTGTRLAEITSDMTDANMLWPDAASLSPELVDRREALEKATEWRWALSGSGPTLFCVLPSLEEAVAAGTKLSGARPAELARVSRLSLDLDN